MTEPARGAEISVVSGRHARLPGPAGLRRACQAVLIVLVVEFSMGMVLNLYVPVPSSDQHASFVQEIKTAPLALTVHAVLGLLLIGGAGMLLIRAIGVRDWLMTAMAAAGLGAILGAFTAGELFVRDGQNSKSLIMAFLTAAALACYVGMLGRASAGFRQAVQAAPYPAKATPSSGYPEPVPLPSRPLPVSGPQPRLDYYRPTGPQPRLDYHPATGPQPYLRDPAAGPRPVGAPWQPAAGQAPPRHGAPSYPGAMSRPGAPARRNLAFPPATEPPPAPAGPDFQNPGWGNRGPAAGPPGSGRWPEDEMPGAW